MARRAQPPQPAPEVKEFRNTAKIDRAIDKIRRRISDVEALQSDRVRWNDDRISNVQHAIVDTVREVFGAGSSQFDRHQYFRIKDGAVRMRSLRESPAHFDAQRQVEFEASIPGAITRLEGLIAQLGEKRQDLAEPEAAPRAAFEGRNLNPSIAAAAGELYRDGHYAQAVFEAGKMLIALVKRKSGSSLDGVNLMRTVFSPKNPILAFNALADQSDLDEQEGMMHLYEGAAMAVRNPGGHRVRVTERPDRALQYIEFLGLLADRLDETRRP